MNTGRQMQHQVCIKCSIIIRASLKTPITTVSTVNTDRHSDQHNIQKIQTYTLDKMDRNLKNIRKIYDQLKGENDNYVNQIGNLTTERNELRKRGNS